VDTTTIFYCIDLATANKRDVTFQTVFVAGMIYSLIIAAIILVWGQFTRKNTVKSEAQSLKTT
jgi:hypothetical protein